MVLLPSSVLSGPYSDKIRDKNLYLIVSYPIHWGTLEVEREIRLLGFTTLHDSRRYTIEIR